MSTDAAVPINTFWSSLARVSGRDYATRTQGVGKASQYVDQKVVEAFRIDQNNPVVAYLGAEYFDFLQPNWDGEGARAITIQTLRNTSVFLASIRHLIPPPDITPEADGFVQLEWYVNPTRVFSVSFGPSNTLSYSGIFGEGCSIHGSENLHGEVPEEILGHIERICSGTPPGKASSNNRG